MSVGNFYSDYILLHPTRIVVNTRIHSSSIESIKSTIKLNIAIDNISLDLSRNDCEILLLIWNVYKHLFETKNNSFPCYNGNNNNNCTRWEILIIDTNVYYHFHFIKNKKKSPRRFTLMMISERINLQSLTLTTQIFLKRIKSWFRIIYPRNLKSRGRIHNPENWQNF